MKGGMKTPFLIAAAVFYLQVTRPFPRDGEQPIKAGLHFPFKRQYMVSFGILESAKIDGQHIIAKSTVITGEDQ